VVAHRPSVNGRARDYRPFIIADADTGHGGDPHVRNLIRRFVEAGVPGYHIEDQRPGTKKCGHQGGKVLVAQDEQNKRLNAARFHPGEQYDAARLDDFRRALIATGLVSSVTITPVVHAHRADHPLRSALLLAASVSHRGPPVGCAR